MYIFSLAKRQNVVIQVFIHYKNDVVANGSVAETPCQQAVVSDAAVTDVQCT